MIFYNNWLSPIDLMLTSVSNPLGSGLVIGKMKKIAVTIIPTGLILNEISNYRGGAECLRHKH
jgi:hypothetical protein